MQPLGNVSLFNVQPGREFIVDGQKMSIGDLQPGTVLTGTITTRTTPVTIRTTSTLNGAVWWAQGNYVILTLESGENKEYKVPDSFRFVVEGKPASVHELKPGMRVTATKIDHGFCSFFAHGTRSATRRACPLERSASGRHQEDI